MSKKLKRIFGNVPHQEHWNEVFPLEHRDLAYGWALAVGNRVLFGEEGRPDSDFFLILFCDRLRCATLGRQAERQRMSLAVTQVSGGRADQLGDFVGVLELGAINLDAGSRIPEQSLGHGLDHPGFS